MITRSGFLAVVIAILAVGGRAVCGPAREKTVKVAGIVMAEIPGGSFEMGSAGGRACEKPVHTVGISPFLMGVTEITQGQYTSMMGKNPSSTFGQDTLPVDRVSWFDAARYCNRLSDRAGLDRCYDETSWKCDFSRNGFRLPTETEWEYACRAGTKTAYSFGDSPSKIGDYAWYGNTEGNSANVPHPVGLKKPNPWGLFDMYGSDWEWCNDWFGETYTAASAGNDPRGPSSGKLRVMRGGSWISNPEDMTSFHRECYVPSLSYLDIGFAWSNP